MRGRLFSAALFLTLLTLSPARADDAVTGRGAATAFDEICVRQAPGFRRSRSVMARHGLTVQQGRGVVGHASGRLSVVLGWGGADRSAVRGTARGTARGAGRGGECRVTYQVPDVDSAIAAIEAIAQRLFEEAWGRRQVPSPSGRTGTAWTVSIQGARGEMVHMPYSGPGTQGVMILRF